MTQPTSFSTPTVFISAPQDMQEEAEVCCQVIAELARDFPEPGGLTPYKWDFTDHAWTSGDTWQKQIPRVSVPQVKAVICLLGERLGCPLPEPPEFVVPADLTLPEAIVHPWPQQGVDGKIPLTGTVFEFLDGLQQNSASGEPLGDRLIACIKCDKNLFQQKGLAVEDRQVGFEHYKDSLILGKRFKREDQAQYNAQIDWLDIFYETQFRIPGRPALLFGNADREKSLQQLREFLRKDLRRLLGITTRTRKAEPKGLFAYQPEDYDILTGRDRAIHNLLRQLSAHAVEAKGAAIILLTGLSGQGKSSLLRAGVVGRIRNSSMYRSFGNFISILIDVSLIREEDPVLFLARAIEEQSGFPLFSQEPPLTSIAQEARAAEILRRVDVFLKGREQALLLAVDQAENILFLQQDKKSPSPDGLVEVLTLLTGHNRAWCILAVPIEQEKALANLFKVQSCNVPPSFELLAPDADDIEQIIRNVCAQARLPIQNEQVQDIRQQALTWINDQASPGAVLPLLSLLLSEWVHAERKRRRDKFLQMEDEVIPVPTLSSVLDTLGEQAWEEYARVQPAKRIANEHFGRLFRHLVTTDFSGETPEVHLRSCAANHPAIEGTIALGRTLKKFRLIFNLNP